MKWVRCGLLMSVVAMAALIFMSDSAEARHRCKTCSSTSSTVQMIAPTVQAAEATPVVSIHSYSCDGSCASPSEVATISTKTKVSTVSGCRGGSCLSKTKSSVSSASTRYSHFTKARLSASNLILLR